MTQVVALRDLTFSWDSNSRDGSKGEPVLDIPAWTLNRGEQVLVQGPSGCGKSTLLSLLCGILAAPHGTLEVLGHDLVRMRSRQRDRLRASHIGVIFQQFNLVPYLSVADNIGLASYFGKARHDVKALTRHFMDRLQLPRDLLHSHARHLSVGQQQRVAAVRALINRPQILIADEPTSALDEQARDHFISLLLETATESDTTVIVVSHDSALRSAFSRVEDMSALNRASRQGGALC